eukprot:g52847.t1
MANKTDVGAGHVHGTDPQHLIEKILASKIYDHSYWKEHCFGLTAESLVDKAVDLVCVGGTYGGQRKPTKFMCLLLKMLQIQPDKDIVVEFILNDDYKYVRILGATYMRLVGSPTEIYQYLEPLLKDFRKVRIRDPMGAYKITHMDEVIDGLLTQDYYFDIALPRLPKRVHLEAPKRLPPRVSGLEALKLLDETTGAGEGEQEQENEEDTSDSEVLEERRKKKERNGKGKGSSKEKASERDRDRGRDRALSRSKSRERERTRRTRSRSRDRRRRGKRSRSRGRERARRRGSRSRSREREGGRRRSRSRERDRARRSRRGKDRSKSKSKSKSKEKEKEKDKAKSRSASKEGGSGSESEESHDARYERDDPDEVDIRNTLLGPSGKLGWIGLDPRKQTTEAVQYKLGLLPVPDLNLKWSPGRGIELGPISFRRVEDMPLEDKKAFKEFLKFLSRDFYIFSDNLVFSQRGAAWRGEAAPETMLNWWPQYQLVNFILAWSFKLTVKCVWEHINWRLGKLRRKFSSRGMYIFDLKDLMDRDRYKWMAPPALKKMKDVAPPNVVYKVAASLCTQLEIDEEEEEGGAEEEEEEPKISKSSRSSSSSSALLKKQPKHVHGRLMQAGKPVRPQEPRKRNRPEEEESPKEEPMSKKRKGNPHKDDDTDEVLPSQPPGKAQKKKQVQSRMIKRAARQEAESEDIDQSAASDIDESAGAQKRAKARSSSKGTDTATEKAGAVNAGLACLGLDCQYSRFVDKNAFSFTRFDIKHQARAGSYVWFTWLSLEKSNLQYRGMLVPYAAKNAYVEKKNNTVKTEAIKHGVQGIDLDEATLYKWAMGYANFPDDIKLVGKSGRDAEPSVCVLALCMKSQLQYEDNLIQQEERLNLDGRLYPIIQYSNTVEKRVKTVHSPGYVGDTVQFEGRTYRDPQPLFWYIPVPQLQAVLNEEGSGKKRTWSEDSKQLMRLHGVGNHFDSTDIDNWVGFEHWNHTPADFRKQHGIQPQKNARARARALPPEQESQSPPVPAGLLVKLKKGWKRCEVPTCRLPYNPKARHLHNCGFGIKMLEPTNLKRSNKRRRRQQNKNQANTTATAPAANAIAPTTATAPAANAIAPTTATAPATNAIAPTTATAPATSATAATVTTTTAIETKANETTEDQQPKMEIDEQPDDGKDTDEKQGLSLLSHEAIGLVLLYFTDLLYAIVVTKSVALVITRDNRPVNRFDIDSYIYCRVIVCLIIFGNCRGSTAGEHYTADVNDDGMDDVDEDQVPGKPAEEELQEKGEDEQPQGEEDETEEDAAQTGLERCLMNMTRIKPRQTVPKR